LSPAGIIATSSARLSVDFLTMFIPRDEADKDCERDRVDRRSTTGSATVSASDDFFVRFVERPLCCAALSPSVDDRLIPPFFVLDGSVLLVLEDFDDISFPRLFSVTVVNDSNRGDTRRLAGFGSSATGADTFDFAAARPCPR
jgi:hypothetical protein